MGSIGLIWLLVIIIVVVTGGLFEAAAKDEHDRTLALSLLQLMDDSEDDDREDDSGATDTALLLLYISAFLHHEQIPTRLFYMVRIKSEWDSPLDADIGKEPGTTRITAALDLLESNYGLIKWTGGQDVAQGGGYIDVDPLVQDYVLELLNDPLKPLIQAVNTYTLLVRENPDLKSDPRVIRHGLSLCKHMAPHDDMIMLDGVAVKVKDILHEAVVAEMYDEVVLLGEVFHAKYHAGPEDVLARETSDPMFGPRGLITLSIQYYWAMALLKTGEAHEGMAMLEEAYALSDNIGPLNKNIREGFARTLASAKARFRGTGNAHDQEL